MSGPQAINHERHQFRVPVASMGIEDVEAQITALEEQLGKLEESQAGSTAAQAGGTTQQTTRQAPTDQGSPVGGPRQPGPGTAPPAGTGQSNSTSIGQAFGFPTLLGPGAKNNTSQLVTFTNRRLGELKARRDELNGSTPSPATPPSSGALQQSALNARAANRLGGV